MNEQAQKYSISKIPFQNTQVVDNNGYLTPEWQQIMERIIDFVNLIQAPEGILIPGYSGEDIAKLTQSLSGTLVYNLTTNEALLNKNGTFEKIDTTP